MWHGTTMGDSTPADFEQFILDELGARAQFIGVYETLPTPSEPDSGGRSDLVFAVHEDDIPKFAPRRFMYDMRWVDDVLDNEKIRMRDARRRGETASSIYRPEVHALRSWD